MASDAKPGNMEMADKWMDWNKTLINYLWLTPAPNGVPLSYVIRDNEIPNLALQPLFLDAYVNAAPLAGVTYLEDSAKACVIIKKLITKCAEVEAALTKHEGTRNGRFAHY